MTSPKRPTMWQQALDFHKQIYPDDFGVVIKDAHYYPKLAELMVERRKKSSRGVFDIEPLPSTLMVAQANPRAIKTKGGQRLMFTDGSGAFRVSLGKGEVVHILRCRLNSKVAIEYAVGTRPGLLQLHNLVNSGSRKIRHTLPRSGVWTVGFTDRTLGYVRKSPKSLLELKRFTEHPMYAALEADFQQFYDDVEFYTRYGQSGMRKVLLSGPPGTGKTTIAMALAAAKAKDIVCVLGDGENFAEVCYQAAARKQKTVIIAEEVDAFYRPGADLLAFLDGMKTPRNPAGTYIIFSTNYPKRIDPRILKRPGRIDRVLPVGSFRRKAAAACARMYLPEDCQPLFKDRELGALLDRTTPAEIKEIIITAIGITRQSKRVLDGEVLKMARQHLTGSLSAAALACDDDMDERANSFDKFGAGIDPEELLEELD